METSILNFQAQAQGGDRRGEAALGQRRSSAVLMAE